MSRIITTLLFIALSFPCFAAELIQDQQNCFRGPFKSHQAWLDILSANKKNFNKEAFLAHFPAEKFNQLQHDMDCVDFTYQVDGLTVEGYYLKPKVDSGAKLPVVIFNRGGNARYGYVVFGNKMGYLADIAMGGYIVIGSQYRGASGSSIANNGHDEFGGADVNDVVALLDLAKEIPQADTSRMAMMGWSRGVMQSYLASRQMPDLKAIIAIAGVAEHEQELVWRPKMEKVFKARIPNFENNRSEELKKRSVINWLDELPPASPILLLHGSADKNVNVQQSQLLADALSKNSHPHKLVIYQDDNHGLVKHRDELIKEIHAWLSKYI